MKKRPFFILTLLLIETFYAQQLYAQPGSNDPTFNPGTGAENLVTACVLQPDGKVIIAGSFTSYNNINCNYITRLNSDGSLDADFNPGTGANNRVNSCALQPDGKIVIGGGFTSFNGTERNYIARLNSDGSLDASFNPGAGPNNWVWICALQPDGKIIIGGSFTNYNGIGPKHITRLNSDGSLDASFNPGYSANNSVLTCALQPDGKIIIGGSFTSYNNSLRNRIARLNADGSLDISFNSGAGANQNVNICVLQPDGKIIIGGSFTSYNNTLRNCIARINAHGSLDAGFDPGTGANYSVVTCALQPDGKIIIGGTFDNYNLIGRIRIARLNTDGSLDSGFDPGMGANNTINTCALQSDGKIIIAGNFTNYNGIGRNRIARIYDCSPSQPGIIFGPTINRCPIVTYSIAPIAGADDYTWSLPSGWSGSSTTTSITTSNNWTGGIISVIANSDTCSSSIPRTLTVLPFQQGTTVCLVTVDTLSTHNIVYWEKPVTALIDSFFIYREITTNNYQKVGAVAYEDYNEYHDYSADPNTTTYKYKVSVLDTCGFESAKSGFHNTIHLQNNGNGNLAWTQYGIENSGNPVTYYRVYRDDFGTNNFQPINTSIPGGNTTYTDVNYASYPNARYVVDVNWDISCTPFRSSVTTTRSNRWQNNITVGIEDEFENMVLIYPNPASDIITIEFPETLNISGFEITNMLGQTIYSEVFSLKGNTKKQIDVSGFAEGIYLLEMQTVNGNMNKKIIIQ